MRLSTSDIAEATGGELHGEDCVVSGAVVDSRLIVGGELFIPLRGKQDGHDWVPAALDAGAAAYLSEREPLRGTAIRVARTDEALMSLGSYARTLIDAIVVGVTGSVGKTTTKDMIRSVLASKFSTHASAKSYNNEIGVPLTLLGTPSSTQAMVIELGARARGDIATLCEIVRPSIGVVTRVAPVHTERFGDIETVARAKRELVEALPADGTAILNAGDPRVAAMAASTSAAVVLFGPSGDVRGEVVDVDRNLRALARITLPSEAFEVRLSALGAHQVVNATAAAAVGYVCGIPAREIANALKQAELSPLRMSLSVSRQGVQVLDDTYNANPESVEAALRSLASLPARRRVAVLGRMAELGLLEAPEHRRITALAEELGVQLVAVDAPQYGVPSISADEVLEQLGDLQKGDAVLVKGSRIAGLETVAAALRAGSPEGRSQK